MPNLNIITREGEQVSVPARPGVSLMEIIRDNGIDDLLALCSGVRSCATCHVYLQPETMAALPAIEEEENELLESSDHRTAQSRLSCQVIFSEQLDGIVVTIAPED